MKKFLMTGVKWLWLLFVIGFIVVFVVRKYALIQEKAILIPKSYFILSLSMLILSKFLLTLFMYDTIRLVRKYMPFQTCYRIYHISQLAKYLPGNIWHFVSKAAAYRQYGFTLNDIKNAMLAENLLLVMSAFVVGSSILSVINYTFLGQLAQKYLLVFGLLCVVFGVAGWLLIRILIKKQVFERLHSSEKLLASTSGRLLLRICLCLLLVWLTLGGNFYLILKPFLPPAHATIEIIGIFAIAFSLGYITPFAPAGVGIRESVLILGLARYQLSYETVIIASAVTRIMYIFVELGLAAATIFFRAPDSPGAEQGIRE